MMIYSKRPTKPVVLTEKNISSIFRKAQKKLEQGNTKGPRGIWVTKPGVKYALKVMGYSTKEANEIIKKVWK